MPNNSKGEPMNISDFITFHFPIIIVTFFLGIAFYFSNDPQVQAYFWFPLLFSLLILISSLISIKLLSHKKSEKVNQ